MFTVSLHGVSVSSCFIVMSFGYFLICFGCKLSCVSVFTHICRIRLHVLWSSNSISAIICDMSQSFVLFYFKFIFICSTFKSLEPYIISLHFAVKEWECFWAVILRAFESSFKDFLWTFLLFHSFSLQSLYLTIFQKIVICLLSHTTLTYEWFKHKKAPKSKNEPMLCLYITHNLAKNSF